MRLVQQANGEMAQGMPNVTSNRGAEIMHKLELLHRRTQVCWNFYDLQMFLIFK